VPDVLQCDPKGGLGGAAARFRPVGNELGWGEVRNMTMGSLSVGVGGLLGLSGAGCGRAAAQMLDDRGGYRADESESDRGKETRAV
jgi:hypothetical protein